MDHMRFKPRDKSREFAVIPEVSTERTLTHFSDMNGHTGISAIACGFHQFCLPWCDNNIHP
jgi:hypothetical protein